MKISKKKIAVIIVLILISLFAYRIYINSTRDASYYDSLLVSGFYDFNENEFAVPGDALHYSEYYYENDVSSKLSESYQIVTNENIGEAEHYLRIFKLRYLSDSFSGDKAFFDKLNEGDYFHIKSGCSGAVDEGHFLLHFYDKESKTIYYMWRCQ